MFEFTYIPFFRHGKGMRNEKSRAQYGYAWTDPMGQILLDTIKWKIFDENDNYIFNNKCQLVSKKEPKDNGLIVLIA